MSEKKIAVLNITEALIEKDSYNVFICYNRASPPDPHSLRIKEPDPMEQLIWGITGKHPSF